MHFPEFEMAKKNVFWKPSVECTLWQISFSCAATCRQFSVFSKHFSHTSPRLSSFHLVFSVQIADLFLFVTTLLFELPFLCTWLFKSSRSNPGLNEVCFSHNLAWNRILFQSIFQHFIVLHSTQMEFWQVKSDAKKEHLQSNYYFSCITLHLTKQMQIMNRCATRAKLDFWGFKVVMAHSGEFCKTAFIHFPLRLSCLAVSGKIFFLLLYYMLRHDTSLSDPSQSNCHE